MSRLTDRVRPMRLVTDGPRSDVAAASTFASRLEALFAVERNRGDEQSCDDVASALAAAGGAVISARTLDRLRRGLATNPTLAQVEALANHFRVPPVVLLEPQAQTRLAEDRELMEQIPDPRARQIAMRLRGLSPDGVAAVARIVDHCAALEGRTG